MARQRTKRRIELGRFEAVVLGIGYIASLGMVGVAGFVIGQRTVPESLGRQERLLRLPVSASGGSRERSLGSGEPEMTFYDQLLAKKGAPLRDGRIIVPEKEPKEQPREQPPRPKGKPLGTPPGRGTTSRDTASASRGVAAEPGRGGAKTEKSRADVKPARPLGQAGLGVSGAPARRVPPPRVTAEARATARAIRDGKPAVASRPQGPVSGPKKAQSAASRLPSAPPGVTPQAAATARELAGPHQPGAPAKPPAGTWSVQVNATQDKTVATRLARGLRERGYDAFVVEQSREGVIWYRVRVGRLKSIEMANGLVRKLKETEDLPHAFVASD